MNEKDFFITGFIVNYVAAILAATRLEDTKTELLSHYTARAIELANEAWYVYVSQTTRR